MRTRADQFSKLFCLCGSIHIASKLEHTNTQRCGIGEWQRLTSNSLVTECSFWMCDDIYLEISTYRCFHANRVGLSTLNIQMASKTICWRWRTIEFAFFLIALRFGLTMRWNLNSTIEISIGTWMTKTWFKSLLFRSLFIWTLLSMIRFEWLWICMIFSFTPIERCH